LIKELEARR